MNPENKSTSHNVCYVLPHFNVSYWIQVDRGDFPCTDLVGEFSIIDDAFQVSTYGLHISSDFSFLKNYALRRCFSAFESNLPSRLNGVPHAFAVLKYHVSPFSVSHTFHCRCYFESFDLPPVDFDISLTMGELQTQKNMEKKNEN